MFPEVLKVTVRPPGSVLLTADLSEGLLLGVADHGGRGAAGHHGVAAHLDLNHRGLEVQDLAGDSPGPAGVHGHTASLSSHIDLARPADSEGRHALLDPEDGEAERGEVEEDDLSGPAADTDEAGAETDHSDVVSAGDSSGDFLLESGAVDPPVETDVAGAVARQEVMRGQTEADQVSTQPVGAEVGLQALHHQLSHHRLGLGGTSS